MSGFKKLGGESGSLLQHLKGVLEVVDEVIKGKANPGGVEHPSFGRVAKRKGRGLK